MDDWIQYSLALAYGIGAIWFALATLYSLNGATPSPHPVLALLSAVFWPVALLAVAAVLAWNRAGRARPGGRSPLRR
ncbi:hypothetical protein [Arenibaculum sp.]|jgi:hypothetical protein|uniref:hypothetical protein n=1 Tax=Arenibaculum sp. TaxID=2865862 RepID=UPI002E144632|nr:hypothetical protein [Arenibaculum sp.]